MYTKFTKQEMIDNFNKIIGGANTAVEPIFNNAEKHYNEKLPQDTINAFLYGWQLVDILIEPKTITLIMDKPFITEDDEEYAYDSVDAVTNHDYDINCDDYEDYEVDGNKIIIHLA